MNARPDVPVLRLIGLILCLALAIPTLLFVGITHPDMDRDGWGVFDPDTDGDKLCNKLSFSANANSNLVDPACSGIDPNDDNDGAMDDVDQFPMDPSRPEPRDRPLSELTIDAYPELFFDVGEIQHGYTLWLLTDKVARNNTLNHLYDASQVCVVVREEDGVALSDVNIGSMVVVTEVITTTSSGLMLVEGNMLMVNSPESGEVEQQTSCLALGY